MSESQPQSATNKPRVLFVYYTYTQQSRLVAEVMADVLRERGCDVKHASIGFTDKRWSERFTRFPLKHAWLDVLGMLPAQLRGATGEIEIPAEVRAEYDLVCIGSPTWFFKPSVPVHSFLKSDEAARLLDGKRFTIFVVARRYWSINLKAVRKQATKIGGQYVEGTHFLFAGRQIRSFLALISYFGKGENRERYAGLKIPPSMLKPDFAEQAQAFANGLADQLSGAGEPAQTTSAD